MRRLCPLQPAQKLINSRPIHQQLLTAKKNARLTYYMHGVWLLTSSELGDRAGMRARCCPAAPSALQFADSGHRSSHGNFDEKPGPATRPERVLDGGSSDNSTQMLVYALLHVLSRQPAKTSSGNQTGPAQYSLRPRCSSGLFLFWSARLMPAAC